jgi:hypothetical protein
MAQVFVLLGVPLAYFLLLRIAPMGNLQRPEVASIVVAALCLAIPGVLFYLAKDRVIALSPRQCWGERPASTGGPDRDGESPERAYDPWHTARERG